MDLRTKKPDLIKTFSIFREVEWLYITTCGAILRQEELQEFVTKIGADNIKMVTRKEIANC